MQKIVSPQACSSGMGDCTVVDLEVDLPYDMRTEAILLGVGLAGGWLHTEHIRFRRGVAWGRA
jgi:hypothetical protein